MAAKASRSMGTNKFDVDKPSQCVIMPVRISLRIIRSLVSVRDGKGKLSFLLIHV